MSAWRLLSLDMSLSHPPLHHLLPMLDSALFLSALPHPYQLHIRILQTAHLPVLFQKYAIAHQVQNMQGHMNVKYFIGMLVCFRYIWPLEVMQGICWLGRQQLAGGTLMHIVFV